jgi:mannose-6-phosphate isomerase-like protein (cupin superfamily)
MAATFIRAAEAPRFEIHGAHVTGYASPTRGSASLSTWRLVLSPGVESPVHQLSVDETFIVLRGEAEYEVGGSVVRVGAGDGVTVQANTPFRIRAVGGEAFEAIACVPKGCEARVEGGAPFVPPWAA